MAVIGLDLGGTKLAGAIFTERGRLIGKRIEPLAGRKGRAVGELLRLQLRELLAIARAKQIRIGAVGVSVPGISYSRTGTVWAPNIPGWKEYPLRRELAAELRRQPPLASTLRIAIDSDRACYILGESWRGAAMGCRNAIFLAVGTGIGAGILADGKIVRGAHDVAGAIGWMALDRPFQREYAACGCFEYHASGAGLDRIARELASRSRPRSRAVVRQKRLPSQTAADLFLAFERGDPLAKQALRQAIEFWGMAVANLVSVFNPEKIIFGGGVFGPATRFLDQVYAEARKWAQPVAVKQVKIEKSKLGVDAGLYGAARLALGPPG